MDYRTLHQLMDQLEQFERETGRQDLPSFAHWLHVRLQAPPPADVSPVSRYGDYNGQIARAVGVLYQHAKHYIKTALQGLPLNGLYDFTFLAVLAEDGDQRKSDLIALNMLEFSPGTEVMRRLLRHGLIEDFPDPADARSRRVRLTPAGATVFKQAMERMVQATAIVGGNLTDDEKAQFLAVAQKLLHFHRPVWENDRGRPLEEIAEKYLDGESASF